MWFTISVQWSEDGVGALIYIADSDFAPNACIMGRARNRSMQTTRHL